MFFSYLYLFLLVLPQLVVAHQYTNSQHQLLGVVVVKDAIEVVAESAVYLL